MRSGAGREAVTFADRHLERRLARDGFVRLPGLARDRLEELRSLHTAHTPSLRAPQPEPATERERAEQAWESEQPWRRRMGPGSRWRSAVDELGRDDKARLFDALAPILTDLVGSRLPEHRLVLTSILDKRSGPEGTLPLHHDPTFVDEARFRSVTIWVALDDIGEAQANGPLCVLPGSHRVADALRGTRLEPPCLEEMERLWPATVALDAEAGDAVVWDSRLMHGSPPNASSRHRRAVVGVAVPRQAALVHAIAGPRDTIRLLRVDDDFYRRISFRAIRDLPVDAPEIAVVARPPSAPTAVYLAAARRARRLARVRPMPLTATSRRWRP